MSIKDYILKDEKSNRKNEEVIEMENKNNIIMENIKGNLLEATLGETSERNSIQIHITFGKMVMMMVATFIIGIVVGLGIYKILSFDDLVELEIKRQSSLLEYKEEIKNQSMMLQLKDDMIDTLDNIVITLNTDIQQLKTTQEENLKLIAEFEKRKELYDKYEYVLLRNNKRTDITYSQISKAEQFALERNINPNLVFAVTTVESNCTETAINKSADARGYNQFIERTAKYIYEQRLKRGVYKHEYALNGTLNFEMAAEYLKYLMDYHKGDIVAVLSNYNGSNPSSGYYQKINNVLVRNGKPDIYQIARQYKAA